MIYHAQNIKYACMYRNLFEKHMLSYKIKIKVFYDTTLRNSHRMKCGLILSQNTIHKIIGHKNLMHNFTLIKRLYLETSKIFTTGSIDYR